MALHLLVEPKKPNYSVNRTLTRCASSCRLPQALSHMKHASASTLQQLAPLIEQLRALPDLVERTPGTFYYRSSAFLHFHEDLAGLFADAKLNFKLFERHRVSTRPEQSALFTAVVDSLSGAPSTTRSRSSHSRGKAAFTP